MATFVFVLIMTGYGTFSISVSDIASEEACHQLAKEIKAFYAVTSYKCFSYPTTFMVSRP